MAQTRTEEVLDQLRQYESQNVTFLDPDGSWPIVWERAKGMHVWDVEGERYLDLTAAFGVAAAGHANPQVVKAGQKQMGRLLHAMGDVHPHALKGELARELSRLTFERWEKTGKRSPGSRLKSSRDQQEAGKTIFCNSGFEAVEAALKTATLATQKAGVIVFEGAYHGLGYGSLNATHRPYFRSPFTSQLREFGHFVPFPTSKEEVEKTGHKIARLLRKESIGAILVEPVQARGGINIPAAEFLPLLRQFCDQNQALLIFDEIYTGFGRTGKWFACEWSQTVPDLICLGKALTGGFPLSACVGKATLMDAAWPKSHGEALHTSTFLGHPVGCAMALAQIQQIEEKDLVKRSEIAGKKLLSLLKKMTPPAHLKTFSRGIGLMAGLELRLKDGKPATEVSLRIVKDLLQRGIIVLPEGDNGNVIGFTPPLIVTDQQLELAVSELAQLLDTNV